MNSIQKEKKLKKKLTKEKKNKILKKCPPYQNPMPLVVSSFIPDCLDIQHNSMHDKNITNLNYFSPFKPYAPMLFVVLSDLHFL